MELQVAEWSFVGEPSEGDGVGRFAPVREIAPAGDASI